MGKVSTISGKVNGAETQFLPNTGAQITVVPQELVCPAQVSEKCVVIEGSTGEPEKTQLALVEMELRKEKFQKEVAVSASRTKGCPILYTNAGACAGALVVLCS